MARKKSNWDVLQSKKHGETAATRDVHGSQIFERGSREFVSNPWPRRILAWVMALITGVLTYVASVFMFAIWDMWQYIMSGESWTGISFNWQGHVGTWKPFIFAVFGFLLSGLVFYEKLMAGWRSENSMADTTDINPHIDDQHISLVEELQRDLDWFPDAGAHASVQVSSMLSHVMVSNKGIKKVDVTKRYDRDGKNEDGERVFKGQVMYDEFGMAISTKEPLFDTKYADELMTASGVMLSEKDIRAPYDVRKIPYNPPAEGQEKKKKPQRVDRDKGPYDTVADFINHDWELPDYEVQRPGGAYLVDTQPTNTMV